jgi:general secretion pathway protein A
MYIEHFNLTERPFSITPDPRFLYMSARHREALAHLLYGLGESGGFVQLTGEVGTGKTTICRCLLEQVPDNVDIAMVLNPKVTATELIASVCDELGVDYPAGSSSIKTLTDALNRFLLDAYARGRRIVLIIDEAQNLDPEVLEQVRLLTNLETSTQKLLQIILIGQPELRTLLARDDMRQLSQRITARYHLEAITRDEAGAYISHRLQICGNSRSIFNKRAIDRIHQLSGGIPRLINVLCDRAMLGAYVEGKMHVDRKVVKKAAHEVLAEEGVTHERSRWKPVTAISLLAVVLVALAVFYPWERSGVRMLIPGTTNSIPETAVPVPSAEAASANESGSASQPEEDETEAAVDDDVIDDAPSLAGLLMTTDSSYYRSAWTELLSLWAVELPAEVKPDFCDYAAEYGLMCLMEKGTWNALRQFDRPAILKLVAADGRRVPVLLQHLDDSIAEILVGNELYRLTIEQLEPYWYGDYTLLLQKPPGGYMYLKVGDRGEDVVWVRQQTEIALGIKLPTADPYNFDYVLQKHVLEFQRRQGLVPDGVVGKYTIIHLNSQSDRDGVPRLSGEPGWAD